MKLARYTKEPGERKLYTIDYSHWLDEGESITAAVFVAVPPGQLAVDESVINDPPLTVSFYVVGGVSGESYTVECTITTSINQIREDQVLFSVKEY